MQYRSVFRAGLFEGQSIVVTGGGSGIGRCTAHELAALGAKVALVGRKPEKLEKVREEIAAAGGAATTHPCDIRDEDQVLATVEAVLATHGRIDGLVNNAGVLRDGVELALRCSTRVDVRSVLRRKVDALDAYRSQMQRQQDTPQWPILSDVSDGAFVARFLTGWEVFRRTMY